MYSGIPQSTPHPKASMTEERKYALLFAATLLSARRLIENIVTEKPDYAEEHFIRQAIRKAELVLKCIDHEFPGD
jgi:hypothetical protein